MTHHNITGGAHPWYVFKGNPILKVNKINDHSSVVDYDIMPTPVSIAQAFNYLNQGINYDGKRARGECCTVLCCLSGCLSVRCPSVCLVSDLLLVMNITEDAAAFKVMRNRKDFINAQWALGGAATGAPVHFHNSAW
jgi:hypothetical protein